MRQMWSKPRDSTTRSKTRTQTRRRRMFWNPVRWCNCRLSHRRSNPTLGTYNAPATTRDRRDPLRRVCLALCNHNLWNPNHHRRLFRSPPQILLAKPFSHFSKFTHGHITSVTNPFVIPMRNRDSSKQPENNQRNQKKISNYAL